MTAQPQPLQQHPPPSTPTNLRPTPQAFPSNSSTYPQPPPQPPYPVKYPATPAGPAGPSSLHPSIVSRLDPSFLALHAKTISHWPPPPTNLPTVRAGYSQRWRFVTRQASGVGGIGETTVPGWAKYPAEIGVRVYVPPGDVERGLQRCEKETETSEKERGRAGEGIRGVWPVHFNFHGGGWAVGDLETSAHICHHICAQASCCVIDIEYRLIPEYPFPIGIMDGLSAVLHILANHKTFSIDPTNFTLGGESSGGTIALVLNHILRDMGMGDRIKGIVAGTPTISDVRKYATPEMSPWPSMQEAMYTPLLNWEKLKWFDTFKWMSLSSIHPGVSPKEMKRDVGWFADAMKAPDFKNLAPVTWVGTAGVDPLRDEAEAYAEKVRDAGNNVIIKRYEGMPHAFVHMDAVLEGAREFVDDVIAVVRDCLHKKDEEKKETEQVKEEKVEDSEPKVDEQKDEMQDEVMNDAPSQSP